jgi:hypothetical protein
VSQEYLSMFIQGIQFSFFFFIIHALIFYIIIFYNKITITAYIKPLSHNTYKIISLYKQYCIDNEIITFLNYETKEHAVKLKQPLLIINNTILFNSQIGLNDHTIKKQMQHTTPCIDSEIPVNRYSKYHIEDIANTIKKHTLEKGRPKKITITKDNPQLIIFHHKNNADNEVVNYITYTNHDR